MDYKKKIIAVAESILKGDFGVIEGARFIVHFQLGYGLEENKDMLFFLGIASETDHLPIGNVRGHWNKDSLQEKDKEIQEYEDFYKIKAMEACKNLINFLSK